METDKVYQIIFEDKERKMYKMWMSSSSKTEVIKQVKSLTNQNINIIYCEKV
jgi:antibiotic biosynthesis monooxygenase (ABM) superfamily enzyme